MTKLMAFRWFLSFRGISREARLVIYASFLPSFAIGMAFTDLPYHLTAVQGLSGLLMGTIIMVMGIATLIASPPVGILADRYGRKRVLIISNIVMSIGIALFSIFTSPVILILVAVVKGVCEAGCSTASVALLAAKSPPATRTPAFSILGFVSTTAFALGGFSIPLVLVFERMGLGNREAHILLYLLIAAVSLLSTLFVVRITEVKKDSSESAHPLLLRKSRKMIFRYSVTGFIIGLGTGVIIPLMTYWVFLMYRIPDVVSGPVLGIPGLIAGLAVLGAPVIAGRFGILRAVVLLQGSAALFLLMIPFSPVFLVAGVLYAGRALMMNIVSPIQQSLLAGLVDENELGIAAGISSAIWRTPNTVSTSIGAGLLGAGYMDLPFFIAALLYGISIALFWFLFKDVRIEGAGRPVGIPRKNSKY